MAVVRRHHARARRVHVGGGGRRRLARPLVAPRALSVVAAARVKRSAQEWQVPRTPWNEDDVCDWLADEGLRDCIGAFRAARIDGDALLRLRPDTVGDTLGLSDEQTEFRICAALSPLKQRSKRVGGKAAPPPGPPPKAGSPAVGSNRGGGVSRMAGELRILLGGTSTTTSNIMRKSDNDSIRFGGGAYVVLTAGESRVQSTVLPEEVPVMTQEWQSLTVPIETEVALGGSMLVQLHAWTPMSTARDVWPVQRAPGRCP